MHTYLQLAPLHMDFFVVFWVCILDKSVIDTEQLSNRSQTCTRLNRIMAPDVKVEKQNKNYTHIQLRFKCGLRVNPTKHTCADSELEVIRRQGQGPRGELHRAPGHAREQPHPISFVNT